MQNPISLLSEMIVSLVHNLLSNCRHGFILVGFRHNNEGTTKERRRRKHCPLSRSRLQVLESPSWISPPFQRTVLSSAKSNVKGEDTWKRVKGYILRGVSRGDGKRFCRLWIYDMFTSQWNNLDSHIDALMYHIEI